MRKTAAKIGLVATIATGLVSGAQGESPLWFAFGLVLAMTWFAFELDRERTC